MKLNKSMKTLLLAGALFPVNAMRTIKGKVNAWRSRNEIHTMDTGYTGSNRSDGSKRGRGMREYHRRQANMNRRDHNSFGTFSRINPVYGIKLSWE